MFLFCPPILRPAQQYTKGRSLELTNTSKYQVGIQVQLLENWRKILQNAAKNYVLFIGENLLNSLVFPQQAGLVHKLQYPSVCV